MFAVFPGSCGNGMPQEPNVARAQLAPRLVLGHVVQHQH